MPYTFLGICVEQIRINTHLLWYVGRSLSMSFQLLVCRLWSLWVPGAVPNSETSSDLSAVGKYWVSGFRQPVVPGLVDNGKLESLAVYLPSIPLIDVLLIVRSRLPCLRVVCV